jgi:hypothetical protein
VSWVWQDHPKASRRCIILSRCILTILKFCNHLALYKYISHLYFLTISALLTQCTYFTCHLNCKVIFNFYIQSFIYVYFGTGIFTQGLTLARQVLCHLFHSTSPVLCWVFSFFYPILFFFRYWGLNSGPTPWATPIALFVKGFLEVESRELLPWADFKPRSFWVARITYVSL